MLQLDFKQPPFMLAIFFISVGWMITWYVSSIERSPTIQYHTGFKDSIYTVELRNLTKDKTFKNLVFLIEGSFLIQPRVYDHPPAWHSDIQPKGEKSSTLVFKVDAIHPGLELKLSAKEKGASTPVFKMKTATEPVRLVQKFSVNAMIMRNYEFLIMIILSLWGIAILIYYKIISKILLWFKLNVKKKEASQ